MRAVTAKETAYLRRAGGTNRTDDWAVEQCSSWRGKLRILHSRRYSNQTATHRRGIGKDFLRYIRCGTRCYSTSRGAAFRLSLCFFFFSPDGLRPGIVLCKGIQAHKAESDRGGGTWHNRAIHALPLSVLNTRLGSLQVAASKRKGQALRKSCKLSTRSGTSNKIQTGIEA